MKIIAIIPARMGSSRFPGKPLAPLFGMPMIEHIYRRVAMCPDLSETYVATCDREIFEAVEAFGGKAIMTADTHERASDRIAEAAANLDADIIVMPQGDEPMITPEMVSASVKPMIDDPAIQCVNLTKRIDDEDEFLDPNTIKVVMDRNSDAIFMSREAIPTKRLSGFDGIQAYKQVCVIPFRAEMLKTYTRLTPTPAEQAESIDMLRLLEHGYSVKMIETSVSSHAVDSPEDLALVERLMQDDPLLAAYAGN